MMFQALKCFVVVVVVCYPALTYGWESPINHPSTSHLTPHKKSHTIHHQSEYRTQTAH